MRKVCRRIVVICCACGWLSWAPTAGKAQAGAPLGTWPNYGGDLGNTRYSPLTQINAGNFSKLEVAWRFKTDNLGARPEYNPQVTPLMLNGVVYTTAGSRRAAVALGVSPSNRRDGHIRSCCAPTTWVAALGDGLAGGLRPIERSKGIVSPPIRRDDTA